MQHHKFSNGLTLIAEPNPNAHTAAMGIFVRVGSRDEDPAIMGVSHFLEHMMFKGTAKRTADELNQAFDDIGATNNAFTTQEVTAYWAHMLPEYLPHATDLLTDMLRPSLRESDFEVEKQVILEEIAMYDDQPGWLILDEALEQYFTGHPLGHRVLGTPQTVADMTAQQMRAYFDAWYSPSNMTVAAAGKLDFDALVADLEKRTASWQPRPTRRNAAAPAPEHHDVTLTSAKVRRHYIATVSPGPSFTDEDRYAARLLAEILGSEEGSRLYWNLVDPGHADEADVSYSPQDGTGVIFSFASCDTDRADQVEKTLLRTADELPGSIKLAELERARNKLAAQMVRSDEKPSGRMNTLGEQWLYLGREVTLEEELDRLLSVTVPEVETLAAKYHAQPRTIVRLTPDNA